MQRREILHQTLTLIIFLENISILSMTESTVLSDTFSWMCLLRVYMHAYGSMEQMVIHFIQYIQCD